jgi:hypothetical protein
LYQTIYIFNKDTQLLSLYNKYSKDVSYYSNKGLSIYFLSVSIWCIEKFFCDNSSTLQLHAIWHILSSLGSFYLNNIIKSHISIYKLFSHNIVNNSNNFDSSNELNSSNDSNDMTNSQLSNDL